MRGETDRENRARGGVVFAGKGSHPLKAFKGARSPNTPDGSSKRGSGPLFRKKGGKVPPEFAEEREEEEREAKARGGAIFGKSKKPSFGRPGRKSGGKADTNPLTHEDHCGPEEHSIMPDSEKTP